ncbi:MAG: hypothetical protein UR39_C0015G0004 [Candidatus Woesebacteria bacterium GW2011_GWA1_33_30]|uniref:Uncharacterized protein n=1 Tax=Candidatus Woesebacteria bacterium GW2011_GWA2_33_28 TaxID=1618561 RepID=A0A0F9ZPT2_9BACT|nr:MAG: hypothetical protein UR38_C0014G0004 [Candidatus Woesebacteria bacterium GW2011_GWA2_33_28]KKP46541.1 MAG: hypothetical protein UR39_C0015G0004 [Candidatus Woesebacteria bacterium GW2011_GWA1_33_30]KKP48109.1 MAG: hypothetical protein UR40_C0016G0004 [Microgenomates group bacterium GW2011_GWC1_33_32]KKP52167.1 MAG: hypothetical protein UR44_C0004G0081 [Candidatus Woesebacteria bacterium GW2011_GWB1_33_38]KKP56111.1 MAG: hypothetical protein UR48_C0040G0002 [Microgenomates group bacteriu
MGLLPEREPAKNKYENIDEASTLNIERKEVITPVPTQFKAKVTDDKGNKLVESVDDKRFIIKIPQFSREQMEKDIKDGDKEDSKIWSIAYWLRLFKKALFFGWKAVFDR